jgi:gliding motility-associated-like protein
MDLTPYIGQDVTIEIVATDCTASGHYGYVYFDAQCGPMTIIGNGNEFPAGSTNVTVPTCGASGATMCATPGLGPYSWAGADVVPPYNTPSMSNQCFTSTLSTTYTLYMNPPGACAPIERVITTTVTPAPLVNGSVVQAVCGGTTAVVSVTPSGSAGTPSEINWSPAPMSLTNQTTVGTYQIPATLPPMDVTITVLDPLGCRVSTIMPVNPAPPIPTFTITNLTSQANLLTCKRDTINLSITTTYTYGTLNYFWSSSSFTSSASDVRLTLTNTPSQRTYTVKATDPVTQCSITKTLTVDVNTAYPASTVTPSFQNITCSVTTIATVTAYINPASNIRHTIISPLGGPFSASSYSTVYVPGLPGTYTHIATNEVNGCETMKTFTVASNELFPTFDIASSPPNFTLGCGSKSVTTINVSNAQAGGGQVTFTLLSPSSSSVLPPGPLGTINSFTFVNTPGTWTVVARAGGSSCDTRLSVSVLNNKEGPGLDSMSIPRTILNCAFPRATLKGISYTPNIKYTWSFKGPGNQNGDTLTVYANYSARTTTLVDNYTLTIEDNSSTCKTTTIVPIRQNLYPPIARIGSTASLTCLTNTVEITNQSITGISPASGYPTNSIVIAAVWQGPTPQVPTYSVSSYVASMPGVYTLTATDLNNGCSSQTTAIVGENRAVPVLNNPVAPPPPVLDCGSASATASVIVTSNTANLAYQWTAPAGYTYAAGSDVQPLFKVFQTGEYKVTVTDKTNGCSSEYNMQVINGALTAEIEADRESGFAPLTVTFKNKTRSTLDNNNIRSVWTYGNGTSATFTTATTDPQTVYTQPGTYTVTMFASKGNCLETAKKVIHVETPSEMIIPNVFTPNGDGVNDLFFLQRSSNLSSITAEIFDRWGHKVYELKSDKNQIEWDGNNMYGKACPDGTYYYIIKATGRDGETYDKKGTVNLVR